MERQSGGFNVAPDRFIETVEDAHGLLKDWDSFSREFFDGVLGVRKRWGLSYDEAAERKWTSFQAGGAVGSVAHYTGGPNGIASALWLAYNSENKGSSVHGIILQQTHKKVEALIGSEAYAGLAEYMPAPALQLGSLSRGCWGANWANRRCYSFEIESLGRLTLAGGNRWGRYTHGRWWYPPKAIGSRRIGEAVWQRYTLSALITWVNIHRALYLTGISDGTHRLSREWFLPHSAVWSSKSDAGLAFPLKELTDSVFLRGLDIPAGRSLGVIDSRVSAPEPELNLEEALELAAQPSQGSSLPREDMLDPEPLKPWVGMDTAPRADSAPDFVSAWRRTLGQTTKLLERLQLYVGPADMSKPYEVSALVRHATEVFQRSTRAKNSRVLHLQMDGFPGPKTQDMLVVRAQQMGVGKDIVMSAAKAIRDSRKR